MKQIDKPWSPLDVVKFDDSIVRLALFDGEYKWHSHDNMDELFCVHQGKINIQLKNQDDVELNKGELLVVPKNIEHCPKSVEPSYVLMIEKF